MNCARNKNTEKNQCYYNSMNYLTEFNDARIYYSG